MGYAQIRDNRTATTESLMRKMVNSAENRQVHVLRSVVRTQCTRCKIKDMWYTVALVREMGKGIPSVLSKKMFSQLEG